MVAGHAGVSVVTKIAVAVVCVAWVTGGAFGRAHAEARSKKKAVGAGDTGAIELGGAALAKLRGALEGGDDEVFVETVKTLSGSRASNASEPLIEVLALGTTPPLAVVALNALEKLAQPRSADIVLAYCGNRNAAVRKSALLALSALTDPRAGAVFLARLGDEDQGVRSVAAVAAARRLKAEAAPRLRGLLETKDGVAAVPLGQVAPVGELPSLIGLRGRVSDADYATLLGEILKRTDVPDPARVEVVQALADVPGADATTALAEYVADPGAGARSGRSLPSQALAKKMLDERGKTP
jgi:HEAT repeat protein